MSSRALRRLQREEEEKKQLRKLQGQTKDEESGEESEEMQVPAPKVLNAFDMLNANRSDDGSDSQGEKAESEEDSPAKPQTENTPSSSTISHKHKKAKKKKKSKKKRVKEDEATPAEDKNASGGDTHMDEIDLALKSLSAQSGPESSSISKSSPFVNPLHSDLNGLLAVESKHLNALNEMKRLFGNVVLENEEEGGPSTPRRRGRGPQQLDLSSALAARHSPVSRGQGLSGLALRRNFLIQGKEEWPKAAGGGLGMDFVERLEDGTIEYRFVHNTVYQDVQRQFISCVESMDPQRMIAMLLYNPYHVSTLLQVSEIAKQQGDHSVSADLLERALFTFGRSVHSSFTNALSEGKARLNFDRPENREFWLAAWRYMNNLGQRGTWRTAYEWAKLIFSLDPELDPYCIYKVIDQLALRGGQQEHFLKLSRCSSQWTNHPIWTCHPNIDISLALVENRLKMPQESRATLKKSMESYPWIFARLFQELNLDHIPKSIWGATPRTAREKLDCETYVAMAKDLWNTPEATALLFEVASYATDPKHPPTNSRPIILDEARHAILLGIPAIIDCIPRTFTTQNTSSYDPFPPYDDLPSYNANPHGQNAGFQDLTDDDVDDDDDDVDDPPLPPPNLDHIEIDPETAQHTDVQGLQSFFSHFIPWLGRTQAATGGENDASAAPGPSNEMEAAIAASAREAHEAGLPAAEIQERGNRLLEALGQASPRFSGQRGSDHGDAGNEPNRQAVQEDEGAEPLMDMLLATAQVAGLEEPNNSTPRAAIEAENEPHHNADALADDLDSSNLLHHTTAHLLPDLASSSSTPPHSTPPHDQDLDHEPTSHPASVPYNETRNQHWLAGTGLLKLKAYTETHGTDPAKWMNASDDENEDEDGHALLMQYASRLVQLKSEQSRRFILEYTLPQGAGAVVKRLIEGEVERLRRGGGG